MVTRTFRISVLALWLLTGRVWSQTTTTATSSAPATTSTFVSPSFNRIEEGGLSEDTKIGISVGVTFAFIILVGVTAVLCVIGRRHRVLTRPETRLSGPNDVEAENVAEGDGLGKGKDVNYMSPASAAYYGVLPQAPDGLVYPEAGYPAISGQMYAPPQQHQTQTMVYPTAQSGTTYIYPDPNQQSGYAGPSNTQYQPESYRQSQQQQGGHISWIYPMASTSPVDAAPSHEFEYKYLQGYQRQGYDQHQQQQQDDHYQQNGEHGVNQGYGEETYYVPPPRLDVSELADQRKPIELMGEGHYKEAP